MHSCIYSGQLEHHRRTPVAHAFRHRLFMVYLDLDELPEVFDRRWLWSARRPALAWFRRRDHFGDPSQPLADCVRERVQAQLGFTPGGPVRVLTHLRYLGHCFNPVSIYYCFDGPGERVEAMVLEVTNTPWKECHCYVLAPESTEAGSCRFRFGKDFHVSPFLPMDLDYDWTFAPPGDALKVRMSARRDGRRVFGASLAMRRQPLSGPVMAARLARQPAMTLKVVALIHWQALRLWWKGVPYVAHPGAGGRGDASRAPVAAATVPTQRTREH